MRDTPDEKKIVAVRTFADDVKRARERSGMPAQPTKMEEPIREPGHAPKTSAAQNSEPAPKLHQQMERHAPEKDSSEPIYQNEDGEEVTLSDEPTEVPPFHSIRTSNTKDTSLGEGGAHISLDNDNLEGAISEKSEVANTPPQKQAHQKFTQKKIEVPESAILSETESIHGEKGSVHIRDGVFDTEEALISSGEGTIVSDKKRTTFKLFPEIFKSVHGWLQGKQTSYEKAHTPEKSVERSSRRKDVIQAAASQAKQAPRSDYDQITERLKNVERVETDSEFQIKDEEVMKPGWSHRIGEEKEEAQNTQETALHSLEEFTDETNKMTVEETAPQQPAAETEPTQPHTATEESGFAEYREKYGDTYNPKDVYFNQQESLEPAPEEGPAPEELERPQLQKKGVPAYRRRRVGQPRKGEPQAASLLTLIAVIITAILLGVGTTVWWFTRNDPPTETAAINVQKQIVNTQATVNIPLGGGRDAFIDQLMGSFGSGEGRIVVFVPTTNGTPTGPGRIFDVLALSAPGNMLRSVNALTLGVARREDPFIVMKFASFDTVFAGMLEWESAILKDFAPLFGPTSQTNSIDSRINNRDVRVLIDDNGNDRIVYGFIDKNTLLITTDREAYMTVVPSVE